MPNVHEKEVNEILMKIDEEQVLSKLNVDRNCLNCAHCDKYIGLGNEERMRCWYEPGVCDHAFACPLSEVAHYVCDNHRTEEEWKQDLYDAAVFEYQNLRSRMLSLEKQYPQLKDIKYDKGR